MVAGYLKDKKLRSHPMSGTEVAAANETEGTRTITTWRPQDDIIIVGVSLEVEMGPALIGNKDALGAQNAVSMEISLSGTGFDDGVIARMATGNVEEDTAGAHPSQEDYKEKVVMFPEGLGFWVDENEHVNLNGSHNNAAEEAKIMKREAILYYIER